MRAKPLELALVLILAGGCQSTGTPPASSLRETMLRCVGGGAGGRAPVVAGTENEFFAARSRQVITLKPGIESKGVESTDGKLRSLTLMSRDNSLTMTCGCPGGCAEGGEYGCIYVVVVGSREAFCSGDCEKVGACCAGCGWY